MRFILGILLFFVVSVFALTTNQPVLYTNAENFIASQPKESSVSVNVIYQSYRSLEKSWIGKANIESNHVAINKSSLFAQTQLFNASYSESNQYVKYVRLQYQVSYLNKIHNVSGLILLPPQKKPKGVVLFFHSTMTSKLRVPSLGFNDYKVKMLSAIFAANGYVVIIPDYIGLGDDYRAKHPYILYPRPNINDGHAILLASIAKLKSLKIDLNETQLPLFVTGYSEGASYALWFSRAYQEEPSFRGQLNHIGLYLKKTVPIEGAYDVSGVMFPFLLSNQVNESQNTYNINTVFWGSLLKPSLLVNTLLSYAAHNNIPANELFNNDFYNLNCILNNPFCMSSNAKNYDVDSIRMINYNQLKMALGYYSAALMRSTATGRYDLFNNSVKPLINQELLNDSTLYSTASNADVVHWKSNNPITLISLEHDSLVPEANSANAYRGMLESGSTNLKYIKLDNNVLKARAIFGPKIMDHVSFELYAMLIALNEFNNELKK